MVFSCLLACSTTLYWSYFICWFVLGCVETTRPNDGDNKGWRTQMSPTLIPTPGDRSSWTSPPWVRHLAAPRLAAFEMDPSRFMWIPWRHRKPHRSHGQPSQPRKPSQPHPWIKLGGWLKQCQARLLGLGRSSWLMLLVSGWFMYCRWCSRMNLDGALRNECLLLCLRRTTMLSHKLWSYTLWTCHSCHPFCDACCLCFISEAFATKAPIRSQLRRWHRTQAFSGVGCLHCLCWYYYKSTCAVRLHEFFLYELEKDQRPFCTNHSQKRVSFMWLFTFFPPKNDVTYMISTYIITYIYIYT